jgi:hypothetical protein
VRYYSLPEGEKKGHSNFSTFSLSFSFLIFFLFFPNFSNQYNGIWLFSYGRIHIHIPTFYHTNYVNLTTINHVFHLQISDMENDFWFWVFLLNKFAQLS